MREPIQQSRSYTPTEEIKNPSWDDLIARDEYIENLEGMRALVAQVHTTASSATALLQACMKTMMDLKEAQMASIFVRNLQTQLNGLKLHLDKGVSPEVAEPYLRYVEELAREIDWIEPAPHPQIIQLDGGALVETYIYVDDHELSEGDAL